MNQKEVRYMEMVRANIADIADNKVFTKSQVRFVLDEIMKYFGYICIRGKYSKAIDVKE